MATVAAIIGAKLPADAAEDSFDMLPSLLGKGERASPSVSDYAGVWRG